MLSNIKYRGYLFALLGAVLFGSEGIFIRFITLDVPLIIYFQGLFATIFISVTFLSSKNSRLFLPTGAFHIVIIVGVSFIITRLLLFQSLKLIPIAIAVFLLYLFPLQIVIFSHFFLGEKLDKKILVSLIFAFTGVILILLFQETQFTFTNYLGYILALAASFTSAILALTIKKYLTGESSYTVSFYTYLLSALVLQLWILFEGSFSQAVISTDLFFLVLFAVVGVLGTMFTVQSLKYIKAQEYSIISYFEPFSAYLLGVLILQQYLKMISILGGVLICIGGFIIFWYTD
jgi:drug/metabolite transporter (DMT)-like permease